MCSSDLGVRGYGLGDDALWFDEAYSFWFSSQSLSDLWTIIPTIEPHPPLYYTGLKFWRVFGDSEAALRSLSVLFSAATVPAIIIFGRLAGSSTDGAKGAWIGYGAALLFALSPLHIAFAQQARPYAALTFFAALAMCGTAWLITHPEQATKPLFPVSKAATNHRAWAALIGGTAISLWLHNLAVLLPAALVVAGVSFYLHGTHNKAGFVRNAAIASGAVLLLWAPFLPWLWVHRKMSRRPFGSQRLASISSARRYCVCFLPLSCPSQQWFPYSPRCSWHCPYLASISCGDAMTGRWRFCSPP